MALFGGTPPPTSRLEELKRILQRDPTSRQFLALAEEYRRHGKLRDAIITLERGLALHSSAVAAHVALGRIYHQLDRFEDAIRSFTNALRIDRENLVAIRQLAEVYLARGDRLEALKKLKLYRGLNPGEKDVSELIQRLESELAPPPERLSSGVRPIRDAGFPVARPAARFPDPADFRPGVLRPSAAPPVPAPLPPEPRLAAPPAEPEWMTEPVSEEPRTAEQPFGGEEAVFETGFPAPPPSARAPFATEPVPAPAPALPPPPEAPPVEAVRDFARTERERPPEPIDVTAELIPQEPLAVPAVAEPFTIPMDVGDAAKLAAVIPVRETLSGESPEPDVADDSPTAPLVSETLAELYRSQGYTVEAGEVYRTLAATTTDAASAREFARKADELAGVAQGPRRRLESFLARFPARRTATLDDLSAVLREVVVAVPGLNVAALTDREGLAVVSQGSSRNGAATEVLVAELTSFFRSVGRSGAEIGGGPLRSLSLVTEEGTAVLSRVSADYALILQAEPGAAAGEVRWAAARAADRLRPALG